MSNTHDPVQDDSSSMTRFHGSRFAAAAILVAAIAGCASGRLPVATKSPSVFAIDSALARLGIKPLWPGFDSRATPLAYYDGARTVLFRHPNPGADYTQLSPGTAAKPGRDSLVTSNSNIMMGGAPTATVMLTLTRRTNTDESASLAIHELFHVYEGANHPAWTANEVDLFTYPIENVAALALRRLETTALREALGAASDARAQCFGRAFLRERRERFALIGATAAAYERGNELNEGLAQYVEHRSIGRVVDIPAGDVAPERVRERAYAIGEGLAVLLDRVSPSWRNALAYSAPSAFLSLDSLLGNALRDRAADAGDCTATPTERSAAGSGAESDVAALESGRRSKRASFLGSPDPRLAIESSGEPLFPQGFDPLNVERLSATEILHTRFLRLGNRQGAVEVLGRHALTTGTIGAHPLFAGVHRVVVGDLSALPAVRDSAGVLMIAGNGVTGHFRAARADTSGTTITIHLP